LAVTNQSIYNFATFLVAAVTKKVRSNAEQGNYGFLMTLVRVIIAH